MTQIDQIYLCSICGNKVKMIAAGDGTLVCCDKDMDLVEE